MNAERWRRIESICEQALTRPPEERAAFFDDACAGDSDLRREIESLVAQESGARAFLEEPAALPGGAAIAAVPPAAPLTGDHGWSLPVGTRIGPYEVLNALGAGAMGEVFLGYDSRLKRQVALKCLAIGNADDRRRIIHEARAAACLNHPNIAAVYDVVEHEGRWFIVMEYAEGASLRERLARGRLRLGEVLTIGRQLASALAAAHEKGIVHRDLKPANVHVTDSGVVKVLDFGLALFVRPDSHSQESMTSIGTPVPNLRRVGTPAYMAPEQLAVGYVDNRSDIYSLGVMLFEMATGRRPLEVRDDTGQTRTQSSERAPSASSIDPSVPPGLDDVIAKALERDPAKRFESAGEIERALTGLLGATYKAGSYSRARTALGIGAAAAAVVILIASPPSRAVIERVAGRATPKAGTVLAVLPTANPTGDPSGEQFGLAIASLVARNLQAASGLKVVSGEATAPYATARTNLEPLARDLGVGSVLDLTVRAMTPSVDVLARLRPPSAAAAQWERSFVGDPITVETRLLRQLADVLGSHGIAHPLPERAALMRLPTTEADAMMAYVEARALLDHNEITGNPSRATDLLERATAKDARFALGHAALADALRTRFAVEREPTLLGRAASEARTALALDPEESAAHTAFAAVEYESGRREAAATAVRRAMDLQPDNDEAHALLGEILAGQGRADEGIAHIRTAISLRPTSFHHYSTLGFVLYTTSRFAGAIEAYRKASELRPTQAASYEMLGATYQMLGDTERAIGHYEHAMRLGASAAAYANLAVLYFTTGAYEKARTALVAAIERDPKKASLHRDLGDVYRKLNRRQEARAAYEHAIALSQASLAVRPGDPFPIALIALCEANLGRRSPAERHATEAMALAPENRDVLFRAAKVFALTGNRGAGLKALRRALERGYDPEVARRDPELSALRSTPDFERVLAAARPPGR